MGLWDTVMPDGLGGEIKKEFIARPDTAKDLTMYKWPNDQIPMLAQVTVQPEEMAFFIKEGVVVGYLPNGRSTLDGAQIPFLGGLIDKVTGGNFLKAELYFVSVKDFPNNKFGASMTDVQDPKSGMMVRMGVYGEFVYKVTDAGKFILNLCGTKQVENEFVVDSIKDKLSKRIRTVVNGKIVKESLPVLDISAYTDELEPLVKDSMTSELENWGIVLVGIEDFVVSVNDEDRTKLQDMYTRLAQTKMVEEHGNAALLAGASSKDWAAGEMMEGIGEGTAGIQGEGGAAMFMGAGVGLGGGGVVGGAMQGGSAVPLQPAAEPTKPTPTVVDMPTATMKRCPSCGADNPAGMNFCGGCGGSLVSIDKSKCPSCGTAVNEGMKFCGGCGKPVEG